MAVMMPFAPELMPKKRRGATRFTERISAERNSLRGGDLVVRA